MQANMTETESVGVVTIVKVASKVKVGMTFSFTTTFSRDTEATATAIATVEPQTPKHITNGKKGVIPTTGGVILPGELIEVDLEVLESTRTEYLQRMITETKQMWLTRTKLNL